MEMDMFPTYEDSLAQMMIMVNNETLEEGIQHYLGVKLDKFEPGKLWATMKIRDELVTAVGTIHGGVMAAFVDHVLGCVMYPLMKRGQWAATTEFKINYLAPVKSGLLRGKSTVVSLTKRTAVVRMDVYNEDNGDSRLVCVAQGTLLVSDPPVKKNKPAQRPFAKL